MIYWLQEATVPGTQGAGSPNAALTGAIVGAVVGLVGVLISQYLQQRRHAATLQDTRDRHEATLQDTRDRHEATLQDTKDRHREESRQAEEVLVTERFTEAVEQIGSEKLMVRLGGIYALERIARYSPKRDYYTIMEFLAAYVRENAPWPPREFSPAMSAEEFDVQDISAKAEDEEYTQQPPPADIQAIVDVIRRREKEPEPEQTPAHIERYHVQLNLQRTNLYKVDLYRADLRGANLQGANLQGAYLQQCDLRSAQLQEANLQNADLTEAELQGANLQGANLQGAYLRWTQLQWAYLQGVVGLTKEQIKEAFGDRRTILPPPLEWSMMSTEEQTNESE